MSSSLKMSSAQLATNEDVATPTVPQPVRNGNLDYHSDGPLGGGGGASIDKDMCLENLDKMQELRADEKNVGLSHQPLGQVYWYWSYDAEMASALAEALSDVPIDSSLDITTVAVDLFPELEVDECQDSPVRMACGDCHKDPAMHISQYVDWAHDPEYVSWLFPPTDEAMA